MSALRRWLQKRGIRISAAPCMGTTTAPNYGNLSRTITVTMGRHFFGIDLLINPFKGELEDARRKDGAL